MEWHRSVEELLQKYCDESQGREALHRRAYYWYKKTLTCFQLPIIILSAMSGSMQFLSKSYPVFESTIVTCTASTSICVSIISAGMTYLKLGESKTKNEVSQVAWQNFYNTVSHQLNLARELREAPDEFLKKTQAAYDRLFEISPICNRGFITAVRKAVKKRGGPAFRVPTYMNGFRHTHIWVEEDAVEDAVEDEAEDAVDLGVEEV